MGIRRDCAGNLNIEILLIDIWGDIGEWLLIYFWWFEFSVMDVAVDVGWGWL